MAEPAPNKKSTYTRRDFFSLSVMSGMLIAAYGMFTGFIGRFLSPKATGSKHRPMFVTYANGIPAGSSTSTITPSGEQVILTNTGQLQPGSNHSFIAFSSRCPHLGCKVHFEADKKRFLCPCHQGIFNMQGTAVAGPPAQAGQSLSAYDVHIDGNALYLMVEVS